LKENLTGGGKFTGIDLCSELESELGRRRIEARKVKGVVLGEGAAGPLPQKLWV